MALSIRIEISAGELIDKLTILEIRLDRIREPQQRANVKIEYELVKAAYSASVPRSGRMAALKAELRAANEKLWDVEHEIRNCERRGEFGSRFIALARSVYATNDRRSAIKREINLFLSSRLLEEKFYPDY